MLNKLIFDGKLLDVRYLDSKSKSLPFFPDHYGHNGLSFGAECLFMYHYDYIQNNFQ